MFGMIMAMGTFQFTRPRGARHAIAIDHNISQQFQFTRPRGARREEINTSG